MHTSFIAAMAGLVALVSGVAAQPAENWGRYANARFGTVAEVPRHLFPSQDPAPANGDGVTFRSGQGDAALRIWGAHQNEDFPLDALMRIAGDGLQVTYQRLFADGYVVSGRQAASIAYQRCKRSRTAQLHCFRLDYPATRSREFDPVAARIGASLSGR